MVEIINNVKARYAGVVGVELITDARKPEIMVMDVIVGGYLLDYLITLANLSR